MFLLKKKLVQFWKFLNLRVYYIKKFIAHKLKLFLHFFERNPLKTLGVFLFSLFLLIIVGTFITKPNSNVNEIPAVIKRVHTFQIGENPTVFVSARVQKTGVIDIVSQTAGIVQSVYATEGKIVTKGQWVISLSTNAQGGNIASLSRQIAQKSVENIRDTYQTQKEIIKKERDMANSLDGQNDKLRDISAQSIDDTKSLIALNEDVLNSLETQLSSLVSTNINNGNDQLILEIKQAKAGVLTGLLSLKGSLRSVEFQSASDHEGASLSDNAKDLTNRQLDMQEKALDLSKEISELNYKIALVSESLMHPSAPGYGVIERLYVSPGQSVSPGMILATMKLDTSVTRLVAEVPSQLARMLSKLSDSHVVLQNESVQLQPDYISEEPVANSLHVLLFTIPEKYSAYTTDGAFLNVQVAIKGEKSSAAVPFIPLDSLFQTKNDSLVFVASSSGEKTIAVSKKIHVGEIVGSYIRIIDGLSSGDKVIIERNVLEGDQLELKQ